MNRLLLFSLTLLASTAVHAVNYTTIAQMTLEEIRDVTKSLSLREQKLLEAHLYSLFNSAQTDEEKVEYEQLFHNFYKGLYDLVIEELKSFGSNPQEVLHVTNLREDLLEGKLERVPWFIKAIAAYRITFDLDKQKPTDLQLFKRANDKTHYIMSLAEQLVNNHERVENLTYLHEAIETLKVKFNTLRPKVAPVFQARIDEYLTKLVKLAESLSL